MTGLAVLGAQYRLSGEDRDELQKRFLPWALRAGSRCSDLMCIYYEEHLPVRLRSG
jgi:ubiquinone biosynthesis protein COQ4